MKEIKIGDLLIGKQQIFKVKDIHSSCGKQIYTCVTWVKDHGFIHISDYEIKEDFDFEIYSPK